MVKMHQWSCSIPSSLKMEGHFSAAAVSQRHLAPRQGGNILTTPSGAKHESMTNGPHMALECRRLTRWQLVRVAQIYFASGCRTDRLLPRCQRRGQLFMVRMQLRAERRGN